MHQHDGDDDDDLHHECEMLMIVNDEANDDHAFCMNDKMMGQ